MKFHKTILTLLAVMLAVIGTTATVVQAEGPTESPDYTDAETVKGIIEQVMAAPDPEEAFAALTPEAQAAVEKYLTPVSTETTSELIPGTGGDYLYDQSYDCDTQRVEHVRRGGFGNPVAKYRSRTYFCYDGEEVLSADVTTGWWVFPPWRFIEDIFIRESWGPHDQWHIDRAKGSFKVCIIVCRTWKPQM